MLNIKNTIWIIIFLFVLILIPFSSHAQNPQQTLNQYISDLQKNPNDNALREKIIRHVQTMKAKPAIPEEARRHYVMGRNTYNEAKSVQDYAKASDKFSKAISIAPWWPEAYRELGLGLKEAGQYNEAIAALKLYLISNPGSELSRKVQDEIYIIEDKKEKAASAPAADKQKTEPDVSGRWVAVQGGGARCAAFMHAEFKFDGDNLIEEIIVSESYPGISGCGDIGIRGQRHKMGTYFKSGQKEFKYTDFAGILHKIEFVGDTAFETIFYTNETDNRVLRRQK